MTSVWLSANVGNLNTVEDGLLIRQEHFRSWNETLDALRLAAGG